MITVNCAAGASVAYYNMCPSPPPPEEERQANSFVVKKFGTHKSKRRPESVCVIETLF